MKMSVYKTLRKTLSDKDILLFHESALCKQFILSCEDKLDIYYGIVDIQKFVRENTHGYDLDVDKAWKLGELSSSDKNPYAKIPHSLDCQIAWDLARQKTYPNLAKMGLI